MIASRDGIGNDFARKQGGNHDCLA
jgi:hypothetical protein